MFNVCLYRDSSVNPAVQSLSIIYPSSVLFILSVAQMIAHLSTLLEMIIIENICLSVPMISISSKCWDLYSDSKKKQCIKLILQMLTVLPAKNDSDAMFCLQSYQGLRIDRSLVY